VINEPIDLLVDLAADRVGGMVIAANDDFFAPKENLVKDSAPVSKPGEYTARGKWMDGWETRRRREPGHDWAMIRLGLRGIIRHVVVDTSHFTGNFPEACSIEAIDLPGEPDLVELARDPTRWATLVDREVLRGDAINDFPIVDGAAPVSHVRLVIFPDGGVARLRVLGDPRRPTVCSPVTRRSTSPPCTPVPASSTARTATTRRRTGCCFPADPRPCGTGGRRSVDVDRATTGR
jgi:allantoicase